MKETSFWKWSRSSKILQGITWHKNTCWLELRKASAIWLLGAKWPLFTQIWIINLSWIGKLRRPLIKFKMSLKALINNHHFYHYVKKYWRLICLLLMSKIQKILWTKSKIYILNLDYKSSKPGSLKIQKLLWADSKEKEFNNGLSLKTKK